MSATRASSRSASALLHETRGAVLPEFAVAVMPLLLCFFCFSQIAMLAAARMAARHACAAAVRAAVVTEGPRPNSDFARRTPPGGAPQRAAEYALGKWSATEGGPIALQNFQMSGGSTSNAEVMVSFTAVYTCGIAIGRDIVCTGHKANFDEWSVMANQGASYK